MVVLACVTTHPFPSPSFFLPSLPSHSSLLFPPLSSLWSRSVRTPLIAAKGCGGALKLPSGFGRSPAAKRILVHFKHKFAPFWVPKWRKNFLCLFSIKRMWELLGTLRSRGAFYCSAFVPSWGQSIEMSLPLEVWPPSIADKWSGGALKLPQRFRQSPASKRILVHLA